jgi:hypothetical protein
MKLYMTRVTLKLQPRPTHLTSTLTSSNKHYITKISQRLSNPPRTRKLNIRAKRLKLKTERTSHRATHAVVRTRTRIHSQAESTPPRQKRAWLEPYGPPWVKLMPILLFQGWSGIKSGNASAHGVQRAFGKSDVLRWV